jgi:hypothetical protein
MTSDERVRKFQKQMKRAKFGGGGLLVLGLVNLLDSYTPFPIPLVGTAAWLTSIALILVGGIWFYQFFRPRVDEIVHLGVQHTRGYLTVVIVHELLGVPVKTAAKTLAEMYREGIILKVSSPEKRNIYECVFQIPNVENNKPKAELIEGEVIDEEPLTPEEINKEILEDFRDLTDD